MKKIEMCENTIIHQDIVDKVKLKMPKDEKTKKLANFYKMFSDSTKVRILWALDISEMCVCDLTAITNVTKSAISHTLSTLKDANLVKSRRNGKIVYYSLADSCVREILEKAVIHTINE